MLLTLQLNQEPISRLKLTKLLFLLEREFPSQGGNTFYQFVPYKYGPFSFSLMREAEQLMRDGLVFAPTDQTFELTDFGRRAAVRLDEKIRRDIVGLMNLYGKQTAGELIERVYSRYPWFTLFSQWADRRMASRPAVSPAVYTLGYEGIQVEKFLNCLLMEGITTIVDVRCNAWSRRFGFHGSTLARLAGYLEIGYRHIPELGIPSSQRAELSGLEDRVNLLDAYSTDTLQKNASLVSQVGKLLLDRPTVFVCKESDPLLCHRSRLAIAVATDTGLPIVHLKAG